VLEKFTPNQRLIVAVALSFAFFIGYTTLVHLKSPVNESNTTKANVAKESVAPSATVTKQPESLPVSNTEVKTTSTDTLTTISAKEFTLKIDTLGRISSVILSNKKHNVKDGKLSELVAPEGAKPIEIRFADQALNEAAAKVPYTSDASSIALGENGKSTVVLTQNLPELTVTKTLTFYADGHYDAKISLSNEKRYFVYLGQHPQIIEQMMTVVGGMIYSGDNLTTIFKDGGVKERSIFTNVHFISGFDQYYATIMYGFDPSTQITVEGDTKNNAVKMYMEGGNNFTFNGYIGPKEYKTLEAINPILTHSIEYGWFTFVAVPIFKVLMWIHGMVGNWGWSIIALTILIRIFLYPLTYKGMVSMQKIKEIAPRIKEVQEKYKGDPARMNAAVMEMYKKHGANPLGGCLPLVLQIPVFFAIYRVLLNAVELQGAPWILWIDDLSRGATWTVPTNFHDLFAFVLPILMGATMYFQQRITPSNFTDPLQEKIFKYLPLIFTFFFVTFPAGLVLYWFVNNLFSIAQQYMVNKQFEAARAMRHETHLAEKHHEKD
jgi:YidC/Oxa1 family membrane protein insertase